MPTIIGQSLLNVRVVTGSQRREERGGGGHGKEGVGERERGKK